MLEFFRDKHYDLTQNSKNKIKCQPIRWKRNAWHEIITSHQEANNNGSVARNYIRKNICLVAQKFLVLSFLDYLSLGWMTMLLRRSTEEWTNKSTYSDSDVEIRTTFWCGLVWLPVIYSCHRLISQQLRGRTWVCMLSKLIRQCEFGVCFSNTLEYNWLSVEL